MNIEKIGENKYKIRVCDEDIIRGRNHIDLGSDGDFYFRNLIIECDEEGNIINPIMVEGVYSHHGEEKEDILCVNVDWGVAPTITIEDIIESRYTPGEIAQLPWSECQI
jgi:hypothetical protein